MLQRMRFRSRGPCQWVGLLVVLVMASVAASADLQPDAASRAQLIAGGRVGGPVVERLVGEPSARVMVVFEVPEPRSGGSDGLRRSVIRSTRERLIAALPEGGFTLRHQYESVEAMALDVSWDALQALAADPAVLRIDLDEGGQGGMAQSRSLIGADTLQTLGFSGSGIQAAVIDSGIDSDHPALVGRVIGERCFCSGSGGCCPGGGSNESGVGSGEDDHGHGTNVSGIVGAGNIGGLVNPYRGVAPQVELVAVKVLDSSNSFCCTSDVVAGLDWIVSDRPDVDVVNMSLGTFSLFAGDCDGLNAITLAFASAVNTLRARGVLTTVSSMNNGSGTSMAAPACISGTLSVGAVWDANVGGASANGCFDATTAADQVACFSNSNASTDLFAPGAPTTSSGLGGGSSTYYGTSQAAPAVAGCIAALLGEDPTLTAAQIEAALEASPTQVVDATNGLSFPRLDCLDAADRLGLLEVIGEPVPVMGPLGRGLLGLLLGAVVLGAFWRRGMPGRRETR